MLVYSSSSGTLLGVEKIEIGRTSSIPRGGRVCSRKYCELHRDKKLLLLQQGLGTGTSTAVNKREPVRCKKDAKMPTRRCTAVPVFPTLKNCCCLSVCCVSCVLSLQRTTSISRIALCHVTHVCLSHQQAHKQYSSSRQWGGGRRLRNGHFFFFVLCLLFKPHKQAGLQGHAGWLWCQKYFISCVVVS